MADRRSLPELEELFRRLDIEPHLAVYETLLRQPYDTFRPVIDLLLEGVITPEDLTDDPVRAARGARALGEAQQASRAAGRYLSEAQAKSMLIAVARGEAASVVPTQYDHDQHQIADDGSVQGQFVPGHTGVAGLDFEALHPTAIQRLRGGGLEGGKKLAQEEFLLAQEKARAE